jgi:hypothetical protein
MLKFLIPIDSRKIERTWLSVPSHDKAENAADLLLVDHYFPSSLS